MIMMKRLMRSSVAAAGFAALLLAGACAHDDGLGDTTDASDQVMQVRPEQVGADSSVAPAPGPAKVDSDGNVYASSAAPGTGNPATVGTNTNVNIIPEKSTVQVSGNVEPSPLVPDAEPVETTATITTPAPAPIVETTTPMTSSVQETTTTTTTTTTETTTEEPARTRMRKD
jgi:hypothetical protein